MYSAVNHQRKKEWKHKVVLLNKVKTVRKLGSLVGNTGSGRYDVGIGDDPLLGKEYIVHNDVISMNNGNEKYRWNEHSQTI